MHRKSGQASDHLSLEGNQACKPQVGALVFCDMHLLLQCKWPELQSHSASRFCQCCCS